MPRHSRNRDGGRRLWRGGCYVLGLLFGAVALWLFASVLMAGAASAANSNKDGGSAKPSANATQSKTEQKPAKKADKPAKKDDKPAKPAQKPAKQADKPAKPAKPAQKPAKQADKSGKPTQKPAKQEQQSTAAPMLGAAQAKVAAMQRQDAAQAKVEQRAAKQADKPAKKPTAKSGKRVNDESTAAPMAGAAKAKVAAMQRQDAAQAKVEQRTAKQTRTTRVATTQLRNDPMPKAKGTYPGDIRKYDQELAAWNKRHGVKPMSDKQVKASIQHHQLQNAQKEMDGAKKTYMKSVGTRNESKAAKDFADKSDAYWKIKGPEKVDWKRLGHGTLNAATFVPGIGTPAGALNASWYASEGDWKNAAWSSAAAVPGGAYVKAAKTAGKGVKAAGAATKAATTGRKATAVEQTAEAGARVAKPKTAKATGGGAKVATTGGKPTREVTKAAEAGAEAPKPLAGGKGGNGGGKKKPPGAGAGGEKPPAGGNGGKGGGAKPPAGGNGGKGGGAKPGGNGGKGGGAKKPAAGGGGPAGDVASRLAAKAAQSASNAAAKATKAGANVAAKGGNAEAKAGRGPAGLTADRLADAAAKGGRKAADAATRGAGKAANAAATGTGKAANAAATGTGKVANRAAVGVGKTGESKAVRVNGLAALTGKAGNTAVNAAAKAGRLARATAAGTKWATNKAVDKVQKWVRKKGPVRQGGVSIYPPHNPVLGIGGGGKLAAKETADGKGVVVSGQVEAGVAKPSTSRNAEGGDVQSTGHLPRTSVEAEAAHNMAKSEAGLQGSFQLMLGYTGGYEVAMKIPLKTQGKSVRRSIADGLQGRFSATVGGQRKFEVVVTRPPAGEKGIKAWVSTSKSSKNTLSDAAQSSYDTALVLRAGSDWLYVFKPTWKWKAGGYWITGTRTLKKKE